MGLIKGHHDKLPTKVCVAQRKGWNYQVIHYNYIKHKFVSVTYGWRPVWLGTCRVYMSRINSFALDRNATYAEASGGCCLWVCTGNQWRQDSSNQAGNLLTNENKGANSQCFIIQHQQLLSTKWNLSLMNQHQVCHISCVGALYQWTREY